MKLLLPFAVSLLFLVGCSNPDAEAPEPEERQSAESPSSSSDPESSPESESSSEEPADAAAGSPEDLVGTWESDDGALRVQFKAHGSFVEDLNGETGAYEGKYEVVGDTFHLHADSGEHADGTITGDFHHLELSGYELWPSTKDSG